MPTTALGRCSSCSACQTADALSTRVRVATGWVDRHEFRRTKRRLEATFSTDTAGCHAQGLRCCKADRGIALLAPLMPLPAHSAAAAAAGPALQVTCALLPHCWTTHTSRHSGKAGLPG